MFSSARDLAFCRKVSSFKEVVDVAWQQTIIASFVASSDCPCFSRSLPSRFAQSAIPDGPFPQLCSRPVPSLNFGEAVKVRAAFAASDCSTALLRPRPLGCFRVQPQDRTKSVMKFPKKP